MPQYRVDADSFTLTSSWKCTYTTHFSDGDSDPETFDYSQTTPTSPTRTVTFALALPSNIRIISTKAHGKWVGQYNAPRVKAINDVEPDSDGFVTLSNPATDATSLSAVYKYSAMKDNAERHFGASGTTSHTETGTISEVYLLIDYEYTQSKCIAPSNVKVSASTSAQPVTLSWSAGASGASNALQYYEVARKYSTNGSTWGSLETVGTTTSLSMTVAAPPAWGSQYQYYVRAVGALGAGWESDWAACSTTVKKVRPSLVDYTDPNLASFVTSIKAVHMTELQTNINLMRVALGFASCTFTDIRAHYASLGGWKSCILELRAAIDEMAIDHEEWLAIGLNSPRADVMMQLRRVVDAL